MGKAKYPHDSKRPESAAVRRALEALDVEALRVALTPRQRAFAHEYVVDFNATAAAIRAGYAPTYSEQQGHILTKHKGVMFLIDHLTQSKEAKIVSVSPEYVLQGITAILQKEGARDGDKLRGLELLARHLGMLTDKTEITGKDGQPLIEKQKIDEEASAFTALMKKLQDRADNDKKDVTLL